jgi:hypothetical protein
MTKLLQKLLAIWNKIVLICIISVLLMTIFYLCGGGWVINGVLTIGMLMLIQCPFYLVLKLLIPSSMLVDDDSEPAILTEPRSSYRIVRGSDLQRDGMFLELEEERSRTVLAEVFYSDVTRQMSLTMFEKNVPVDVIKMLLLRAETDLPPNNMI